MSWKPVHFSLPLLAKELVEIANRRSTYILRTIYAVVLFGFVIVDYWDHYTGSSSRQSYEILGTGGRLFQSIVILQMWGIYILTPLLTASSISGEKERDTLQLIFLTKLGRWTILFEKLLGRLVPMSAYLLLTLPAFAVAYSLGGVEVSQIKIAAVAMIMAMLQAGCVTLFCSTWCRTTVGAFLMSLPIIGLSYVIPALMARVMFHPHSLELMAEAVSQAMGFSSTVNGSVIPRISPQDLCFAHVPPRMFAYDRVVMFGGAADDNWRIWFHLPPMLLYCGLFLVLARLCLVRRAHLAPGNALLRLFQKIDRIVHAANDRFTRGVVLVKDVGSLPEALPIHWRETRKKSLGTFRYLVRVLFVLETPAFLISMILLSGPWVQHRPGGLYPILAIFWGIAVLGTAVRASTLFSSERSNSTLEVLLATPMLMKEMIAQKVQALQRLMWVLAAPLLTLIAAQTLTMSAVTDLGEWSAYLILNLTCIFLYLKLTCWIGVYCGLKSQNSTRAMFSVLGTLLIGGVLLPLFVINVIFAVIDQAFPYQANMWRAELNYLNLLLPFTLPGVLEYSGRTAGTNIWLLGLVNTVWYGGLLWKLRQHVLRTAHRKLGRPESAESAPVPWKFLEGEPATFFVGQD